MNPGIRSDRWRLRQIGRAGHAGADETHRLSLLDQCVDTEHFSFDVTRSTYKSDLEVIEAGMESSMARYPAMSTPSTRTGLPAGRLYDQHPDKRVRIEIYINGDLVAEVVANQFRNDLLKLNKGDGHHAFAFVPPSGSYQPPLRLEVRAANRKVLKTVTVE